VHRVALTQGRCHPDAIEYLQRRRSRGDTSTEARRALKRKLSDVIYRALLTDIAANETTAPPALNQPLQRAA